MKKNYITPNFEVSVFEAEDIITVSIQEGGMVGDGNEGVYSPIEWEDEIANG